MKTSFLAGYGPTDPSHPVIIRHIADAVINTYPCYKEEDRLEAIFTKKARETMPDGAEYLAFMMILHEPIGEDTNGYAATMAKVNCGVIGRPA